MSALERYTRRVHETRGLLRQRNLAVLRNYIGTSSEDTVAHEIYTITDIVLLKILWEAGLPKRLQDHALRQYEQLTGRTLE